MILKYLMKFMLCLDQRLHDKNLTTEEKLKTAQNTTSLVPKTVKHAQGHCRQGTKNDRKKWKCFLFATANPTASTWLLLLVCNVYNAHRNSAFNCRFICKATNIQFFVNFLMMNWVLHKLSVVCSVSAMWRWL